MTTAQISKKSKTATAASDKARNAAIAEIQRRIDPKNNSHRPSSAATRVKPSRPKRVSALDAAARVLAGTKEPMRTAELIAKMEAKGLWTSPHGKTPEATLYSAILREITTKGSRARFKKVDRGLFAVSAHGRGT